MARILLTLTQTDDYDEIKQMSGSTEGNPGESRRDSVPGLGEVAPVTPAGFSIASDAVPLSFQFWVRIGTTSSGVNWFGLPRAEAR